MIATRLIFTTILLSAVPLALACSDPARPDGTGGGLSGGSGGSSGAFGSGGQLAASGGASSSGGLGTGASSGGGAGAGASGGSAPTGGNVGADGGAAGGGSSGSGGLGGVSTGGLGGGTDAESAAELVARLRMGWNLGNSLDAPEGETSWGNPLVTKDLLAAVREAGFDAVRIPVTWSLHTGDAPAFLIEPTFLQRVSEVVGLAREVGLVTIINVHHDGADGYDGVEWLSLNDAAGNVTEANNVAVETRFSAVWSQLAAHFKDFDHELLFESMNEVHDGYDAPDPAYYEIVNHLNQVFVDLIRASGGNNGERILVVPGYNTNVDYTLEGFTLPQDSVTNRLILSVHFYDPWSYAGEGSTPTWGTSSPGSDSWGQEDYVVGQYDKLAQKFGAAGIPMIVGEYGAVYQAGYEDYRRYYMEYVTKVIIDHGLLPFYWDNGSEGSGPDGFGLISRVDGSQLHPPIIEAMIKAATETYSLAEVPLPTP